MTGAKNAQLICIKDEGSLIESANQSPENDSRKIRSRSAPDSKHHLEIRKQQVDVTNQEHNNQERNHVRHATSNQTLSKRSCGDDSNHKNLKQCPSNGNVSIVSSAERASRIKISRLPKLPLQPLKMLPKKFALNILEYKINYLKARKGDHMYKKSSVKQPWILMGEWVFFFNSIFNWIIYKSSISESQIKYSTNSYKLSDLKSKLTMW